MTLRSPELEAQRRITRAFVGADAVEVELTRPTRTDDGAGGVEVGPGVLLAPQRFRLLPQEDGATARVTAEGETATPEYILIGDSDVDVERWDTFTLDGRRYQVLYIDNRKYAIKAEVIYLGD